MLAAFIVTVTTVGPDSGVAAPLWAHAERLCLNKDLPWLIELEKDVSCLQFSDWSIFQVGIVYWRKILGRCD